MTHSWDIVGYTFNADLYCPACVVDQVADAHAGKLRDGDADGDPERALARIARRLGIDRQDEHTFDSGDFPKVVFADQAAEEDDYCGSCHSPLLD